MKKYIYAIFLQCMLAGCEYQNEEALLEGEDPCESAVVFTSDIEPIINTNCAIMECHVAGGVSPEFTSYEKIKDRAAEIKHETQVLHMPPPSSGISLSQSQIDQIACWVEQGAPRN